MILLPRAPRRRRTRRIERFLTFLWDIGLEVGHSVRTIDDCAARERAPTSASLTTLIEARLLAGPAAAVRRDAPRRSRRTACGQSRQFFEAKVAEQTRRGTHGYHDTAYNLEPNVKAGPGGLRDIQTIGWVAKRHFGADSLDELADARLPDARASCASSTQAQSFLWNVRFALHVLTGRREDRLLFDHQIRLAQMFGYEDATYTLAVEQFMQRYYRTVDGREPAQRDAAAAVPRGDPRPTRTRRRVPLNARFQVRNDYLEVADDEVFARAAVGAARAVRGAAAEPASCAACARRTIRARRRSTCGSSTRSSARTRATTACSSRSCARRPASRTSCGA